MRTLNHRHFAGLLLAGLLLAFTPAVRAADSFVWNAQQKRISADVQSWPLPVLLQKISATTGWQVFVEPGATATPSAKFKELPRGEALHALLGDLNFALVPETNAPTRLYVFHTTMQAATQRIETAERKISHKPTAKPIPNQLVVTVKPGVDIEAIATRLGAKIIGRVGQLDTYLLEFPDEAATQSALAALNANPDVASVDYNYTVDNPIPKLAQWNSGAPDFNLRAKPLGEGNPVIVGLIDTTNQTSNLCGGLGSFILPGISVAGNAAAANGEPSHSSTMAATILHSIAINGGGQTAAKILPVDVYGSNTATTTFNVANGVYTAVNAGANIINLSLGSSGDSTFLHSVIISASKQGVIFFAAAGNEPVTTATYPAAYPEVVAVTAGNSDGTVASYANRGSFVSVVAPGNSAVCYDGQSWLVQGTSASTAIVSGLAAAAADGSGKTPAQVQSAVVNELPKLKTP